MKNVDLDIREGPPTVIIGPNGSGKTTLLRLLMGLIHADRGVVAMAERRAHRPPRLSLVFQKPVMLKRSVEANIAFALRAADLPVDKMVITNLLATVGLPGFAERPARKLSGGEQQRLALARALARQPDILLLDEPTASLDPAQSKAVEQIIASVVQSGVKVVMTTHDLGQARRLAGDIVLLVKGRIAERGPAEDVLQRPRTLEARRFIAGDLVI